MSPRGRGTAAPFAVIGAPYIHDAEVLAAAFNARGLPGICATPYYFTPTFSKHQGQLCGGVHLHVLDADAVRPLSAGLTLLELIRDTCPNDFALLPPHTEGGAPLSACWQAIGNWNARTGRRRSLSKPRPRTKPPLPPAKRPTTCIDEVLLCVHCKK